MYLNFKKINSAKCDAPMLRLQTMAGKELGPVPFVYGLNFEINYSDLSTIEFKVPYMVNGMLNPMYATLTGYKVIYTKELGVYMITNPEKSGDGVSEIKQVKGYSLEYIFQKKNLYLEEGTYCFWNPMFPEETVLGRIVELDPNWSVGYVAPRLMNCYRTFDEYDNSALNFCYGEVMEKYRCAIVFDVYNKTINAYDAGDDTGSLPIYLSYENLVKDIKVTEDNENMATKLHLYGGDGLTIRDVNPINGDYLIDLSFFLNNGDLDIVAPGSIEKLSDKVRRWRADVLAQQPYYIGLVSLRSSMTAKKLTLETQLNELKGQLQTLTAQQSVYIKEYALEKTDTGKTNKQKQLDSIYSQIEAKNREISAKEAEIASAQTEIDNYLKKIKSVSDQLSISGYFTEAEQLILSPYLIEGELTEETFVATDASNSNTATSATLTGNVSFVGCEISRVSLTEFSRTMYTLTGGSLSIPNANLDAQVVRGTLDVKSGNAYTLTAYLGSIQYSGHDFSKGMITLTGSLSGLSTDVTGVTENNITQYKGSRISFRTSGAGLYFTVAGNDFQQYAVEMELYEFGTDALSDFAWPTYEFDISTANFLYQDKFEPFKNNLELGKSVHLQLGSEGLIHPKIIGVKLNYDDITNFSLLFSNRYQRKDELEYLSDEIHSAAKTSTRFDASKYLYDRTADKMTDVDAYMKNMLDAAVQTIKAAANQSVLIDGAGIHVSSSDDNVELRIVNGMIAMSNDHWKTAKLAIGRFYSKEHKMDLWGVNAELIAGTLLLGSSLYIQTQDGFFTVDDNGVHIDSMKFYITNSNKSLSETLDDIGSDIDDVSNSLSDLRKDFSSVTTKTDDGITLNATDLKGVISAQQAQMRSGGGNVLFDSDGMWLLNKSTKATSTKAIWMNENGILFGSGSPTADPGKNWTKWTTAIGHDGIVADNIAAGTLSGMTITGGKITIGKSSNTDRDYLEIDTDGSLGIGKSTSGKWNFHVDKSGKIEAGWNGSKYNFTVDTAGNISANSINVTNGNFAGTLNASKISGTLTADTNGEIVGPAIYIPNKTYPKFKVDSSGNVTMQGSISMTGNITWGTDSSPIRVLYSRSYQSAPRWNYTSYPVNSAYDWHRTLDTGRDIYASHSYDGGSTWTDAIKLQGEDGSDGRDGRDGRDGDDADVTRGNIARALYENSSDYYNDGIYSYREYGRYYLAINASYILAGDIDADNISLTCGYGGFAKGYGSTGTRRTYGSMMYGSNGKGWEPYFIVTDAGCRMSAQNDIDFYVTGSGVYSAEEPSITSDRRVKNTIEYDMDKYEKFFMSLKPTQYRLNRGMSGRFHTGFIAQDVEQALLDNGLSLNDFAGITITPVEEINERDGIEDRYYKLRYGEFISLNTYMIQKLCRRIDELENRLVPQNEGG